MPVPARVRRLIWAVRRRRGQYRRFMRYYFPSVAEVQAARLMGCKTFTVKLVRRPSNGHALAFIIPAGWYKKNYIEREVQVRTQKRRYSLDFANRTERRAVEIDSRTYHNVVEDYEMDEDLASIKWHTLRVPAVRVIPASKHYNPNRVLNDIRDWFR